jgi:hypothetical protein
MVLHCCMQTHTDAHRRTQTHTDAHRRTQTHTDAHKHTPFNVVEHWETIVKGDLVCLFLYCKWMAIKIYG